MEPLRGQRIPHQLPHLKRGRARVFFPPLKKGGSRGDFLFLLTKAMNGGALMGAENPPPAPPFSKGEGQSLLRTMSEAVDGRD